MARLSFGLAVALAMWVGGAATADAQVESDPIGPTCVTKDDSSSLYETTVTCDADFVFTLRVYHEGRIKHYTNTFVVNSGPTYAFTKTVSHYNWLMSSGDNLNYRGRATEWGTSNYDQNDWPVTVSGTGGCRANDPMPVEGPVEFHAALVGRRFNA